MFSYMNRKAVFAMLCALIICVSFFTVSASAVVCKPADTATVEKKITTKTASKDGITLEYDVYTSPAYDKNDDSKQATIILCFAESGERFSKLFSLLTSDDADKNYQDYVYTAVNLRLPAGERWVTTDESSGIFDAKASPTPAMSVVSSVVADINAVGFPAEKKVVAGIGSGGTAAWYFACHNTKSVSHIYTVNACIDTDSYQGIHSASIQALAYVSDLDKSRLIAHETLEMNLKDLGYSGLTLKKESLASADLANRVIYKLDDPSTTDWLVKNSKQTSFFEISAQSMGKGGEISPSQKVFYGNSAVFTITLEDGYFIEKLAINGKDADLTALVPSATNGKFTYTFNKVESNGTIYVAFSPKGLASIDSDTLLLISTVLALMFVMAAVGTYCFQKFMTVKKA